MTTDTDFRAQRAGRALRRRRIAVLATTALGAAVGAVAFASMAGAAPTLISQGKPVAASSTESAAFPASNAVDGDLGTRWSSAFSDPQWIRVDLGESATISQVVLRWEAAYASAFQIQTASAANGPWTTIFSTTTGSGGTQTLDVSGTGRYVRVFGTQRATPWGYSLFEFQVFGTLGTSCGTTNAALNRPATASSTENAAFPAANAVDGNSGTRWSSAFSDPQWIQVDLGSTVQICRVVLMWEAAYASAFQVQASTASGGPWTTIFSTSSGSGGTQALDVSGTGRYVRVLGTQRATPWGYSLFEFQVNILGPAPTTSPTTTEPPLTGGGPLGPNVIEFSPGTSGATIQAAVDAIFAESESAQFGTQRHAILFRPGTYSGFNAQIGFYTTIAGLGQNPTQVQINGDVTVDAGWFGGNATQNFWRSAENFSITPSAGEQRWAVSQAAPYRRINVNGHLNLAPAGFGWASGGYIADSRVSGQIRPYSQQQWYTRDSTIGSWGNAVWNMVFSGVQGAPPNSFPSPPYTTLATTPVSREKPYLYVDSGGNYRVFVPSLRTNASGASWTATSNTPGTSIAWDQFYVARPGDSAARLNQALAQGFNLFFTPGIYSIEQTINVTRPNTVVLGIGYPTLIPSNGVVPMRVADVDGVRIAGLLFDAGPVNSPILLEVGPPGSSANHAANPISIQDVFFRIGGSGPGKATTSLVVNADNTLIDHIWAWRADHGAGVGWTINTADTGLIVNGDNVLATGLFVEHYQKYEVIWNGQGGRTIFFQNELPYDPPSAAQWMNGSTVGYAAYKVADTVTSHEAWGMGVYCNFTADPTIAAARGFEAPVNVNVRFHNLLTVSLGGMGVITNVINTTGAPAQGTATIPSTVTSYP